MTDKPRITVLTVDDHPLLRSGIAKVLQDDEDIVLVGEAITVRKQSRNTAPTGLT